MLTSIGLIGDVHAEAERLESALQFLCGIGVQQILCVGDIVDGFGSVDRCCELLVEYEVAVVRGNHDHWLLENQMRNLPNATCREAVSQASLTYLEALPATRTFETKCGSLLLCHGVGSNDMQRLTPDDYGYALQCNDELQVLMNGRQFRFMVGGHTHHRMVRQFGPLMVINPGTLYRAHEPCIALLDLENEAVQFHSMTLDVVSPASESVRLGVI